MTERIAPLIQRQLDLESQALADGISRYRNERASRDETELKPGLYLLRESIEPVAQAIKAELVAAASSARRGRPSIYLPYLAEFDPYVSAYIAARTCINAVATPEAPITRTAVRIGTLLREHKLFAELKQQEPNLFHYVEKVINNTVPARQRAAMRKATVLAETSVRGLEWTETDKLHVGMKLIELFAKHTGLIQERTIRRRGRTKMIIEPTERMVEWLEKQHSGLELLAPFHKPMVVPPLPWSNPKNGGYLTHRLDLIKSDRHESVDEYFSADMPEVYSAVNALQATPWRINRGVLQVLEEVWAAGGRLGGLPAADKEPVPARPHDIPTDVPVSALSDDQKRRLNAWRAAAADTHSANARNESKRLAVLLQLSVAREFRDEERFYFPYQLDFRGRAYAVPPVLNPQGDNVAKALLEFARGKPLGEHGGYWLAVHLANEFGYDKASFDDRVAWTEKHSDLILDSAVNPLDGERFWTQAENPWTFLAACFEWAGYMIEGVDYVSHLPIGMDGSCSGLQHFSALLRDPVGGAAVNLLPAEEKADIYQMVADKVSSRLDDPLLATNPLARAWKGNISRKIVKQPCMTFAYSSTVHGMRDQIINALRKNGVTLPVDHFEAAMFLAPIVRECIRETVVAAATALDWLQTVARIAADHGEVLLWTNPVGLPVYQNTRRLVGQRVQVIYEGRLVKLHLKTATPEVDRRGQVNGISPNYVHSMDSAHLMKTVNRCLENGIADFAMIHDSFGCHACDVDLMHVILREEFVRMYQTDWLAVFRDEVQEQLRDYDVELPEPPELGSLDLDQVLKSDFFFS